MSKPPRRAVAVDWSGRKQGFKRKIWMAKVENGALETLEDGRSREEVRDALIEEAERDPMLVVGLDFAFSFPCWFVEDKECASAVDFWGCVARNGAGWLEDVLPPFFKSGSGPQERQRHRLTEERLRQENYRPETVFKLVGPTQVGPGSIRGMPILRDLRKAGFRIWPFDPPELPLVVEIYPRLFYGNVRKSSLETRRDYMKDKPVNELDRLKAACSDDAFDAAASALQMFERLEAFPRLPETLDQRARVEGWIWPLELESDCQGAVHRVTLSR